MTLTQSVMTFGTAFECILYGAHMVLLILYLILQRRNNRKFGGPLALAQMLLFGLCTLYVCLDIPIYYFSTENPTTAVKIVVGSWVIFAMIDSLAQMILLYRCWIIWDMRWVIVAIPGFFALATLGGGLALSGLRNSTPLWSTDLEKATRRYVSTLVTTNTISLVANALTTSLIVTKILLTSRELGPVLGSNRSFRVATAVLIESGLLTFAFQLVYVVLFPTKLLASDFISGPITQIYGITPTLLNIRIVMGSTYDKTTEKTRSLRFAHSEAAATQTTGPSTSAAGVQFQGVDTQLDSDSNDKSVTDDVV